MAKECSSTTCDKTSCEGCSHKEPKSLQETMNVYSNIKHVIGVVSGKGGVGKSFVTGSLANRMAAKGYKVGIMDADITGPSIPKMYGGQALLRQMIMEFIRWKQRTVLRLCQSTFFFRLKILLLSGEDRFLQIW